MQILPTPPTDNLYKFCAIAGMWFAVPVILFISWLGYLNYQMDKDFQRSQLYFQSVNIERNLTNRLASIQAGELDKNKIEGIEFNTTSEELDFIDEALKAQRTYILNNRDAPTVDHTETFRIITSAGIYWLFPVCSILSFGGIYFGFTRWYKHVQKPLEDAHKIDMRIKELTASKIESEIRELRRQKFR